MNKSICLLGVFGFMPVFQVAAQQDTDEHKKETSDLQEVVVTGTRNATDARHLSETVSVIDRKTIEQTFQPSVLPVLTEQVPGLFVTSRGVMGYGVSGGAAGGITLRGLSGGSGQLMVLIDGHPQYMGLMGHPIADAYQSFLADRVEVLRGPASVLYGSNAMGGVINIVTRKMEADGIKNNLNLGYGSYNTLQSDFTTRFRKGRFSGIFSGSYNRTDGHRKDMGFEQYGGYARLGYELSGPWKLAADVNVTHFNASQPGSVFQPLADADQWITRGMTSIALENEYDRTSGALSAFYNWGHHRINDGYTLNPDDTNDPKPYRFISDDKMMGISWYQNAQLFEGNLLTAGVDFFHSGGHAYNNYVEGDKAGTHEDIADKFQNEVAGYLSLRQDVGRWLTFNGGIRVDRHSHMGTACVPQAGFAFHIPYNIEVKTTVGKGFRYPTIREMYMFPPQNPDLKPENLWNYELAFSQRLLDGRLRYGANVFYLKGDNIIMTVPRAGAAPLNMNSGKIENTGLELEASCRFAAHWNADANYSFLHMVNPVPAAPRHKLYAGASFSNARFFMATGLQYINGLYTAVAATGTSGDRTESFLLWNLRVSYRATRNLSLWLRGDNLLAQRYEINAGYPMPKATVMAGVCLDF